MKNKVIPAAEPIKSGKSPELKLSYSTPRSIQIFRAHAWGWRHLRVDLDSFRWGNRTFGGHVILDQKNGLWIAPKSSPSEITVKHGRLGFVAVRYVKDRARVEGHRANMIAALVKVCNAQMPTDCEAVIDGYKHYARRNLPLFEAELNDQSDGYFAQLHLVNQLRAILGYPPMPGSPEAVIDNARHALEQVREVALNAQLRKPINTWGQALLDIEHLAVAALAALNKESVS